MESKENVRTVDDLFRLDRYQLILQIFNEFCIFCMMSNMVFMIFGGAQPKVDCTNVSSAMDPQSSLPMEAEFKSVAVEFNLICDQRRWTTYATSLQMLGVIAGAFVCGQLSDSFGRRKVLLLNLIALTSVCALSAISPNMQIFIAFRCVIGFFNGGVTTVWAVFIIENLPKAHRFWLSNLVTWSPNYMVLAYAAYLTAEWRALSIACALLSCPAILLLAFVIEESPHYLLQKGRSKDAIDALVAITSWSKHPVSKHEITEMVYVEVSQKNVAKRSAVTKRTTYLDLYANKRLATYTLITSFGFAAVNLMTYSLIFNLSVVDGSLYVNTALSGALRYAFGILVAILDYMFVCAGRKVVHAGSVSTIFLCLVGILTILHLDLADRYAHLIRMLTLLAFGTTGTVFTQFCLISAELFPTSMRNLANAHANVVARLGTALAPSIFELSVISRSAPYMLLAAVAIIDVIAVWMGIPETKNISLAEISADSVKNRNDAKENRNDASESSVIIPDEQRS